MYDIFENFSYCFVFTFYLEHYNIFDIFYSYEIFDRFKIFDPCDNFQGLKIFKIFECFKIFDNDFDYWSFNIGAYTKYLELYDRLI